MPLAAINPIPFLVLTLAIMGWLAVMGLPAVLLAQRVTSSIAQKNALLLLAPSFGATTYLAASPLFHVTLGLKSHTAAIAATVAAVILILLQRSRPPRGFSNFHPSGILALLGLGLLVLNSQDIMKLSIQNYFPLTNGDTFAYLGHIDQIRNVGANTPVLSYRAGYAPMIEHAFNLRLPGVSLVAAIADLFQLETHSAFFLVQRIAIGAMLLGLAGLVLFATQSAIAAVISITVAGVANFFAHQALQQFNSSTLGGVATIALVGAIWWTLSQDEVAFSKRTAVIGGILSGLFWVAIFGTSPEAFPVVCCTFGAGLGLELLLRRKKRNALLFFAIAALSFGIWFLPQGLSVAAAQVHQLRSGVSSHPGDWIAGTGILMQLTGVTLTTNPYFSSYPGELLRVALLMISLVAFAWIALGWSVLSRHTEPTPACPTPVIVRATLIPFTLWLIICGMLFARGHGYAMLKAIDYLCFFPALVLAVGLYSAYSRINSKKSRVVFLSLTTGSLALLLPVLGQQKSVILNQYATYVERMPRLDQLALAGPDQSVYPLAVDLRLEALDLFLYINRWQSTPIAFAASDSSRFRPEIPASKSNKLLRVQLAGDRTIEIADICTPRRLAGTSYFVFAPLNGQLRIIRDGGWLPPEGDPSTGMMRWLSQTGRFEILRGTDKRLEIKILATLQPGPDIQADNTIEILIAGNSSVILPANTLPRTICLGVTENGTGNITGKIIVHGPIKGIRQIRVLNLTSTTEVVSSPSH
jgi:hypothetical protein